MSTTGGTQIANSNPPFKYSWDRVRQAIKSHTEVTQWLHKVVTWDKKLFNPRVEKLGLVTSLG